MTPAARVQTAIEVLDEILGGTPAEKALTSWARRSRFAGSKDRAAVRDHVYSALRRRASALPAKLDLAGRALMLGVLAQDGAGIEDLFSGAAYGPGVVSDHERMALEGHNSTDVIDLPEWLVPLVEDALGDVFTTNMLEMRSRAPVFLRANLKKTDVPKAIKALSNEGIVAEASPLAKTALLVTEGARKIQNSKAYQSGLVELQDASSQAAIEALPLKTGQQVLDYCAGGGGKILAIGAQVEGRFVAHDANPQRLRDLPQRAKRAGLRVSIADTKQLEGDPSFDLVFVDAPCSGSGTWRRTPDAKWRFTRQDLDRICAVQAEILARAARHVLISGTMAYATCSLLKEENEAQVAAFLNSTEGWQCDGMHRWSLKDGCDGFFLARLTRLS